MDVMNVYYNVLSNCGYPPEIINIILTFYKEIKKQEYPKYLYKQVVKSFNRIIGDLRAYNNFNNKQSIMKRAYTISSYAENNLIDSDITIYYHNPEHRKYKSYNNGYHIYYDCIKKYDNEIGGYRRVRLTKLYYDQSDLELFKEIKKKYPNLMSRLKTVYHYNFVEELYEKNPCYIYLIDELINMK